jgi:hypothetical protein
MQLMQRNLGKNYPNLLYHFDRESFRFLIEGEHPKGRVNCRFAAHLPDLLTGTVRQWGVANHGQCQGRSLSSLRKNSKVSMGSMAWP